MISRILRGAKRSWLVLALALAACTGSGGDAPTDPTEVVLGETTFVVVLNPTVNDATSIGIPPPGARRDGVSVIEPDSTRGGPTGSDGVVVVAPLLSGGPKVLELTGGGVGATVSTSIELDDLVDLAVSADGEDGAVMRAITHRFGRTVVELTPEMGIDAVNAELSSSDQIILLGGGTYVGDLVFSGSRVTLFGAGTTGGRVTIEGNVTISGSGNTLRGATIRGTVDISGSESAVSFSTVEGGVTVSGSSAVLLANRFCGGATVSGSGTAALGNLGMAPLDGC